MFSTDDENSDPTALVKRVFSDGAVLLLDDMQQAKEWVPYLKLDKYGRVRKCLANALTVLERAPSMRGVLAYDAFGCSMQVMAPPPWKMPDSAYPRLMVDGDCTRACEWLQRMDLEVSHDMIRHALTAAAEMSTVDPLSVWLRRLKWDGTARIGRWLHTYFGADDTPLTSEIGRRWLLGAVARGLAPGCKVDHVLVLEGRQGIGKSSGLRALAGDGWFTDGLHGVDGREPAMALAGKWIVEIAELNAFRGRQLTAIKTFLTVQTDRYRAPWSVTAKDFPRRCVFAATTNESTYLQDDENRRYWPVVTGQVDTAGIARDRDQLWAEAVTEWGTGERWWIDDETLLSELADRHKERQEEDPWMPILAGATDPFMTSSEALERIGVPKDRRTRYDQMRIGQVFKRLGWTRARYSDPSGGRGWRYYAPSSDPVNADE